MFFDCYRDKVSGGYIGRDTMWMHPQAHYADNMLFAPTDPTIIRKHHFSDTSQVALLYIYRPGKLKLSFSDLFVFYQDMPMVTLKTSRLPYLPCTRKERSI